MRKVGLFVGALLVVLGCDRADAPSSANGAESANPNEPHASGSPSSGSGGPTADGGLPNSAPPWDGGDGGANNFTLRFAAMTTTAAHDLCVKPKNGAQWIGPLLKVAGRP